MTTGLGTSRVPARETPRRGFPDSACTRHTGTVTRRGRPRVAAPGRGAPTRGTGVLGRCRPCTDPARHGESRAHADPCPAPARRPHQIAYTRDAPAYDSRTSAFDTYRRQLVDLLPLQRGDIVLDVGCGTGLASSRSAAGSAPRARSSASTPRGDARDGRRPGDRSRLEQRGAGRRHRSSGRCSRPSRTTRCSAPPTTSCSPTDALDNVLAHVRDGGTVAATGGKWAAAVGDRPERGHPGAARAVRARLRRVRPPWGHLEARLAPMRVQEIAMGGGYLASGTVPPRAVPLAVRPAGPRRRARPLAGGRHARLTRSSPDTRRSPAAAVSAARIAAVGPGAAGHQLDLLDGLVQQHLQPACDPASPRPLPPRRARSATERRSRRAPRSPGPRRRPASASAAPAGSVEMTTSAEGSATSGKPPTIRGASPRRSAVGRAGRRPGPGRARAPSAPSRPACAGPRAPPGRCRPRRARRPGRPRAIPTSRSVVDDPRDVGVRGQPPAVPPDQRVRRADRRARRGRRRRPRPAPRA